jgi:hypothetical protein
MPLPRSLRPRPPTRRPCRQAKRKRPSEEPFDDDAALELAYLLLELDELVEAVYQVLCDAKRQQKTLVEATIVTDIAVDFARRVVAEFQLHYLEINAIFNRREAPSRDKRITRECSRFPATPKTFRLLATEDYSVVPSDLAKTTA